MNKYIESSLSRARAETQWWHFGARNEWMAIRILTARIESRTGRSKRKKRTKISLLYTHVNITLLVQYVPCAYGGEQRATLAAVQRQCVHLVYVIHFGSAVMQVTKQD